MARREQPEHNWSDVLRHWERLSPKERSRFRHLLAKSKGLPRNLSSQEQAELRRLVAKTDPVEAASKSLSILNRLWRSGRLALPRKASGA